MKRDFMKSLFHFVSAVKVDMNAAIASKKHFFQSLMTPACLKLPLICSLSRFKRLYLLFVLAREVCAKKYKNK